MNDMKPTLFFRFAVLAVAALAVDCAQNPVTGRQDLVLMSETQEVQIGREEDPKVKQEYGVYSAPAVQQYVSQVGQRLAKSSHRPSLDYHFTVVDSPEINAFALPGGYVYVTRGILAYLNSEAELAAVLGHEIGHVTARHSVQQITAATVASAGAAILQIFLPELRGQAGDTVLNLLGNVLLSGYGREHELEADRLGAEYLARTGYDPQAMIRVIGVLKNQELFDAEVARQEGREPRAYHGLFATHPDNDTRLQEVIGGAKRYARPDARTAREEYLRRIDTMVFGDSPQQGIVRHNDFYHAELGFAMRFPAGWRVKNQPERVLAVSPGSDALIELRVAGPARGSPAEALRRFLRLAPGAEVASTSINGLPAATANVGVRGRPTRVATIFLGKGAYVIAGQALSVTVMNRWQGEINGTIGSFHAISAKERAAARPLAVRIITASSGMKFADLARRSPLGRNAEGYLRLINGKYPRGEPQAGEPIKIVE